MTDKRAGDRDRQKVTDYLRECFAGGYLTNPELQERVSRAVQAKTRRDLDGLLGDMPSETELTGRDAEAAVARKVKKAARLIRLGRWLSSAADDHPVIAGLIWMTTSLTVAVSGIIIDASHGNPLGLMIPLLTVPLIVAGFFIAVAGLAWMIGKTSL